MSTNISHGFALKPGIEPFAFIARVREVMDPARDAADAKLLAGLYADAIDEAWFGGVPIAPKAGYTAWRAWHLEQSRMNPMEVGHDPNEFRIQIGQDPRNRGYYLLVITYNEDLREAFEAMDEISEYGYWNGTDSYPDGVTLADWEIRRALWNRVIPSGGRSNMLTFNLRHASDRGVSRLLGADGDDTSAVFASLPSAAERAYRVGGNAYISYLVNIHGVDVMDAVRDVAFGRVGDLSLVTDVVAAHLPVITEALVTEGSAGTVIDPAYQDALQAACAQVYALNHCDHA